MAQYRWMSRCAFSSSIRFIASNDCTIIDLVNDIASTKKGAAFFATR